MLSFRVCHSLLFGTFFSGSVLSAPLKCQDVRDIFVFALAYVLRSPQSPYLFFNFSKIYNIWTIYLNLSNRSQGGPKKPKVGISISWHHFPIIYTIMRNCAKFYCPKLTFQGCSGISIFHKMINFKDLVSKLKVGITCLFQLKLKK